MRLLIFIFLPLFLLAQEITIKFLRSKPKSLAKDWYISRFLDQKDIKPHEADEAFSMLFRKTEKLEKKYLSITKNKEILKEYRCKSLSLGKALKEDDKCLLLATNLTNAFYATKEEREIAAKRLKKVSPTLAKDILFFNSENLKEELFRLDGKEFVKFFNAISSNYKKRELNEPFSSELLDKIATVNGLFWLVKESFKNDGLNNIKESLYDLNGSKIAPQIALFLITNALKEQKYEIAFRLAKELGEHSYERGLNRDNGLMWAYLLSEDEEYLKRLANSESLNIYSLYAKEKLNLPIELPKHTVAADRNKTTQNDFSDPFLWVELNEKIKDANKSQIYEIAHNFDNYQGEPYRAFLLRKTEGYNKFSFLMPYPNEFGNYPKERSALLLALARQESNFIPTVVSTSYAIGLMQIMPFNIEHIQKAKKLPVRYEDGFKYNISIEYSNLIVNDLEKKLIHPLFISYGYNGGIGYTIRMLKNGLFSNQKYDPWLSMEFVSLDETRDYGKRVLGNYVVYSKLLGLDISAINLIEEIKNPFLRMNLIDGRDR